MCMWVCAYVCVYVYVCTICVYVCNVWLAWSVWFFLRVEHHLGGINSQPTKMVVDSSW